VETLRRVAEAEVRKVRPMELGVVTSIFPHSGNSDKDNYECNVKLKNRDLELRKVPIATQGIGLAYAPRVGDLVLVGFVEGDINSPIMLGRLYNDKDRPPLSDEEEIVFNPPYSKDASKRRLLFQLPGGMVLTITDEFLTVEAGKTRMKIKVDGEIIVESEADVKLQAKGDMTIAAANIKMKADQSFEVKAGSTADIESSATMTIKGATVNLN
jgi:uncharacterized protein involved in type VI secretion and phage assembly